MMSKQPGIKTKSSGKASRKIRWTKNFIITLILLLALFVGLSTSFYFATRIKEPVPADTSANALSVVKSGENFYKIGKNYLKKSNNGLWEMYIEGKPYERGVIAGKLSRHLIEFQEEAFIDQIRKMIPSDFYLNFLKYFIFWFNRGLDDYITEEYKLEIFGISRSASERFSFIGPNYQRMLNYHSAHDIGHALQDYSMVGCTSLGVWDAKSKDSSLIIGRNFDFYVGDKFAENKIVLFEKPDQGNAFMMIAWGGMIGAVSGMNEKGLTVTINAAKSEIPGSARTPISIVAREILQYAQTIEEAWAIAKKRETFVSESVLIGSANDRQAAIIEKSPFKIALVKSTDNYITCVNHFQSDVFKDDPLNVINKKENASVYRMKRLNETISGSVPVGHIEMAAILRDQCGLKGKNIGMGNEKSVNQLIAHHSVIFMPEQRLVWVSTSPWQLGSYACYDLSKIFYTFAELQRDGDISEKAKEISPDKFLETVEYKKFKQFRESRELLKESIRSGMTDTINSSFLDDFIASNPYYFEVYSISGDYYFYRKEWWKAKKAYLRSLEMEIPRWQEKHAIIKNLAECNIRLAP